MNIQCTQKLLDKLKCPATSPTAQNDFFDWHASILLVDRRNTVLLTNNLCHYSLVLYGLKSADFKKLASLFQQALTEVLLAEAVDQETIEKYFQAAGSIQFTRTSNRSILSQMTQTGTELRYAAEDLDQNQIVQTDFSLMRGSLLHSVGRQFICPREQLLSALSRFKQDGQTVFTSEALDAGITRPTGERAFILSVQLPCGDRLIWRKLAVPARCTFGQFHRMIQVSFNWQNRHLYQFQVVSDDGETVAESKSYDRDEFDDYGQSFMDYFSERKRLAAFLSQYRNLRYLYDFGDDWLHLIKLDETVDSFAGPLPCCLDGEGTAPPEDVGGEDGYLAFLSIVENDADTEEKRELLAWAESVRWQAFGLQRINERLQWLS